MAELSQSEPMLRVSQRSAPCSRPLDGGHEARGESGLDILVNNAGVGMMASLAETDESTFDRQFDVNLKGLAAVVAFLASSDGGWITGQVIQASGGMHL